MSIGPVPDIIDVHAHALPKVWVAAVAKSAGVDLAAGLTISGVKVPPWSPSTQLAFMDRTSIAACVLSQPSGTEMLRGRPAQDLARAINEELTGIVADHPDRFAALAVVPLDDMDGALEETAYALDVLGLDGVGCSTHFGPAYLGDAVFEPWLEELNRRRVTLFTHPTTPNGFDQVDIGLNVSTLEFMFDSTRMVANLVVSGAKERFPDISIISTHGGGTIPFLAHRLAVAAPVLGVGKGRPTPTSEAVTVGLSSFYFDLTATVAPGPLDAIRRFVPASQLLLGYDVPMMPEHLAAPAITEFAAYEGFDDAEQAQIRSATALRLFPQLAARRAVTTPLG